MKWGKISEQKTIRRTKLSVIILILSIFMLLSVSLVFSDTPSMPYVVWGIANLNGAPASLGTNVQAYINGALVKSAATTAEGSYTLVVTGSVGDTINFKICSLTASQTTTFAENGGIENLDLSATGTCGSVSSGSGGGSGGGGGGGGGSTAPVVVESELETSEEVSQLFESLDASERGIFIISSSEVFLTKIGFNVKEPASNAEITVSILDEVPSYISSLDKVYQHLLIEVENLDNNVDDVEIEFKVAKTWLNANKYDKNKVALLRYYDGWSTLETSLTGEDNIYVYYTAQSPGFSIFAIKVLETKTATAAETPEYLPPMPPELIEKQGFQIGDLLYIGVILIIIVIIGFIIARFKNRKSMSKRKKLEK